MEVCDISLSETSVGNRGARKHITFFVQYLMASRGRRGARNF